MHFEENEIYHLYNRGNNKQQLFFNEKNYIYFLKKIRDEWTKYIDIICYCLMPNHFHFMISVNADACKNIIIGDKLTNMQYLSKAIGNTLSSYTKAINIQNKTTGNLFQRKTQAKCLSEMSRKSDFHIKNYLLTCFHYIHQNPLAANIVKDLKEWKFSSFPDYYGYQSGTLCNKKLAMELLSLSENDFKSDDIIGLNEDIISKLF